ncbi:5-formyltetrahydrofolate cyclo-ligase [Hyphococcus sp.]|uniref:5-formyltetrahydrofolate cyclo-ligase n=1 Tax=Hyphococcus sp. TaxID=2038636 RepID=UPI003CCB8F76
MLPPISFLHDPKKILRERMKGERRAAAKARPDAGKHAAANFLRAIDLTDGAVVSLYHPMRDELDTEPLAAALIEKGVRIALPVVARKKAPLAFREYQPGDDLVDGAYGERVPSQNAPSATPSILVVPLLAFTRDGGRLGYGGGYYDRTLEALRREGAPLAVGYAYGAQEVDALPLTRLDQPLDWVVTERGAIKC